MVTGSYVRYDLAAGALVGGITVGSDGAIWFTSTSHDKIGRIGQCGELSDFPVTAGFGPGRILSGKDGLLYIAGDGAAGRQVARMTLAGSVTYVKVSGLPMGLTNGPDGAVWVAELYSGGGSEHIARIDPSGTVIEFALPAVGQGVQCGWQCPTDITTGGDRDLWFAEGLGQGGVGIGRLTTAGDYKHFQLPGHLPAAIATSTDGNVWFSEERGGQIGRIGPDGAIKEFPVPVADLTGIPAIAAAPDNSMWIAISRVAPGIPGPKAGKLGHVDPSGRVTTIDPPIADAPGAIAVGPGGRIWFASGSTILAYTPS